MPRIGFGFDTHRLEVNRDFWLGGIRIPYDKGATGHSDADVLLHAICDAILGAAGFEDIGHQFPDTDPQYKNIDSRILLKRSFDLIKKSGYHIINIDSTVCLEKPKIAPFIPEMKAIISNILETVPENISIKATTTEKLGFIGKEEGAIAIAIALLEK